MMSVHPPGRLHVLDDRKGVTFLQLRPEILSNVTGFRVNVFPEPPRPDLYVCDPFGSFDLQKTLTSVEARQVIHQDGALLWSIP
jgi:hypothetical protein